MERYIPVAETRSILRAFGYCSCKQDTKERYWGKQFCLMETDISVRPTEMTGLVKEDYLQFKPGPEYSDRTKPKCSVLFDIPTETSGIWGWIEGLDARSRIHFKILLPSDLLEKGIFKGIQLRKIYTGHYRVCFYQSSHFTIPYTGNTKRAKLPWFYFSSIIIVSEYISLLYHKKVKLWNTIQQKDFFCLIEYLHIDFSVTDLYKSVHHFASILLRIKFSLELQVKI